MKRYLVERCAHFGAFARGTQMPWTGCNIVSPNGESLSKTMTNISFDISTSWTPPGGLSVLSASNEELDEERLDQDQRGHIAASNIF